MNDILQRLEGVKGRDGKYMARCPCHDDSRQSLSVSVGKENKILLNCFAGCSVDSIIDAMGLKMSDLFDDGSQNKIYATYNTPNFSEKPVQEAEYFYADCRLKKVKYRRSDNTKYCCWFYWNGGSWVKGRNEISPGLYIGDGADPEYIFLVEGEKDVDNLKACGLYAVSLPDGAQSKWEPLYDDVFRDSQVFIIPDNDEPGRKYALMCAEHIHKVAKEVRLLDLSKVWGDIPAKADVSDLMERVGHDVAVNLVNNLMCESEPWEPEKAVVDDPLIALFKPLTDFKEEEATWLIPGWIPESQITLIAADGGVGKTTLWCNIIASLSSGKPCVLDDESQCRAPMRVAFCTTEDSVSKKLAKKLRESGATMKNIITMDATADKGGVLRNFKFGTNEMERFVRYYKPDVCVFDPVQGFIPPKVNMGSRNEMRDCLAPLIALGEETGTTFIIICHTNKRKGAYGRDRIADSADLWDISRSVIMAGYTEEQGVRYLSNEKNNYEQLQDTMLFTINSGGQIVRQGTSWKRDRDYMTDAAVAKSGPKKEDCKEFLVSVLQVAKNHMMKSDDLLKQAQDNGYSFTTIKRARKSLNDEGVTENYATGSAKGGNRVWYTRLRSMDEEAYEELPLEVPTPFDFPSE